MTVTDAYIERMKRRDDPTDRSVCRHNIDLHEQRCPQCSVFSPAALKHAATVNPRGGGPKQCVKQQSG